MFEEIEARVVSARVLAEVQGRKLSGTVHSTFRRSCNLLLEDGGLISILDRSHGPNPVSVLIADDGSFFSRVHIGSAVTVSEEAIIFPGFKVALEQAKVWDPTPSFPKFQATRQQLSARLCKTIDFLSRNGNFSGLSELALILCQPGERRPRQFDNAYVAAAYDPAKGLVNSFADMDTEKIGSFAEMLIGLGPGLSPAGDDLLVGYMVSLIYVSHSLNHIRSYVKRINQAIVSHVAGRTTVVGEHMLKLAAVGEVSNEVKHFLKQLIAHDSSTISSSIFLRKIRRSGGSSGSDLICGIILGLHSIILLEEEGKNGADRWE